MSREGEFGSWSESGLVGGESFDLQVSCNID